MKTLTVMSTARLLLRWIWRAWPVLVIGSIFVLHLLMLRSLDVDATTINETVALVLQISGGGLILYSIDSNIGVIRGGSLLSVFRNYCREFPLLSRTRVLEAHGASYSIFG